MIESSFIRAIRGSIRRVPAAVARTAGAPQIRAEMPSQLAPQKSFSPRA